jgi:hypothetical protein
VNFLRRCAAESIAAQAKRFNMKIGFPARTIEIGTPSFLEASFGPPLGQLQPIEFLYGRPRRNFERIGHEIEAFDDIKNYQSLPPEGE